MFLEYLYTDHAPLEKENALEVLALANQYAVPHLMAMCELFISGEAGQLMANKIDQEDIDIIGMFIERHTEREIWKTRYVKTY